MNSSLSIKPIKCTLRRVNNEGWIPHSQIRGQLLQLTKKLDSLEIKCQETSSLLDESSKVMLISKTSLLKQIEDKLGLIQRASNEFYKGKEIYIQLRDRFGKNLAIENAMSRINNLLPILSNNLDRAKSIVYSLASANCPCVFNRKENTNDNVYKYITKSLKKSPKSTLNLGLDSKGYLYFGNYIHLTNIPQLDGTRKNGYLVISTKSCKPLSTKSIKECHINRKDFYSPLKIYYTTQILDPTKLIDGIEISSYKSIIQAINYFAQMYSWAIMNNNVSKPAEKLTSMISSLSVLRPDNCKLDVSWPYVSIESKNIIKSRHPDENILEQVKADLYKILSLPNREDLLTLDDVTSLPKTKSYVMHFSISPLHPSYYK